VGHGPLPLTSLQSWRVVFLENLQCASQEALGQQINDCFQGLHGAFLICRRCRKWERHILLNCIFSLGKFGMVQHKFNLIYISTFGFMLQYWIVTQNLFFLTVAPSTALTEYSRIIATFTNSGRNSTSG
jgi:hypothetical protein